MLYCVKNTTKISRFQTLRQPLQRGVNIVTRLQNGKQRNRSAILGTGDGFCLLQRVQAGCGTHSALINPLNPELNPICYLLALLGAHHFLHFSRITVKSLTFRLLMSYIYMEQPFLMFLDHTQRCSTVGRTPLDE